MQRSRVHEEFTVQMCLHLLFVCHIRIYLGVPQGKGKGIPSRHIEQGSDAPHNPPAALVPHLSHKVSLSAEKRCYNAHTGAPYYFMLTAKETKSLLPTRVSKYIDLTSTVHPLYKVIHYLNMQQGGRLLVYTPLQNGA